MCTVFKDSVLGCLILNFVIGSTHFSFCGNAGGNSLNWRGSFKNAMCSKWLGPVPSDDFPTFKKWVLYGMIHVHDIQLVCKK